MVNGTSPTPATLSTRRAAVERDAYIFHFAGNFNRHLFFPGVGHHRDVVITGRDTVIRRINREIDLAWPTDELPCGISETV